MCGIIGYIGYDNAKNVLIKGLKSLEYRGYDSAGIAVLKNNKCEITKCKGRVSALEEKVKNIEATAGIGHTRWATHGKVSDENSHPHKFGKVTLVHNGIIENYEALRDSLGIETKLKSETDSEVIAALIDRQFEKYQNCENENCAAGLPACQSAEASSTRSVSMRVPSRVKRVTVTAVRPLPGTERHSPAPVRSKFSLMGNWIFHLMK